MADSTTTKKALASALQELMEEIPLDKIKISDICERCGMNRQSFYYHFKDKYDLVNWIFDTEFFQETSKPEYDDAEFTLERLCQYFYENRDFYRRALRVEGQNSFQEHFRNMAGIALEKHLKEILPVTENLDFHIKFYTDAIAGSFLRWLQDKDCIPPEEFKKLLETSISITQRLD